MSKHDLRKYQAAVRKNYRWNFTWNVLDGVFVHTGFELLGIFTIIAGFISLLVERAPELAGWENRLATLVPALMHLGWHGLGIFMIPYVESIKVRKPLMVRVAFLMRLPIFGLALTTYWLTDSHPLMALCFLYFWFMALASFDGLLLPAWHDYVSRMIPVNRRGIAFGVREGLGALAAALALLGGRVLLERVTFPLNYTILFALAFLAVMLSYFCFVPLREIIYDRVKPRLGLGRYMKRMAEIVRRDRNYRRFLIISVVNGLSMVSTMSIFTLKAIDVLGHKGDAAAVGALTASLTVAVVLARSLATFLWGPLGDRFGNKLVTLFSILFAVFANLTVVCAGSSTAFYLAFVLVGVSWGAGFISWMNWVTEFSSIEDRASYIAIRNLTGAPLFVLPVLGGYLADRFGPDFVFLLATGFLVLAFFLFIFLVKEPRRGVRDVFFGPVSRTRR